MQGASIAWEIYLPQLSWKKMRVRKNDQYPRQSILKTQSLILYFGQKEALQRAKIAITQSFSRLVPSSDPMARR
jgi:hypothetical protein